MDATLQSSTSIRPAPDELINVGELPETIIEPSSGWVSLHPGELWKYRGLTYFFAWRDIKVRYKQAISGASWAVFQPLLTKVVFSIFFGRLPVCRPMVYHTQYSRMENWYPGLFSQSV